MKKRLFGVAVLMWLVCAWPAGAQNAGAVAPGQGAVTPPAVYPPAGATPGAATPTGPGAAAANPLTSLAGLGADYKIGPNDLLDVEVYSVPDLKRTVRVNATGLVSLALVGQVSLLGLTTQQAEERLVQAYGEKYLQNPQISVFIREFTTQRVTIDGAVMKPGIYPITGQITLLRAIALAGGGARYAQMEEVMVFRSGQDGKNETLTFNLNQIREGAQPDPTIAAEDVIVVKRDPRRTAVGDSLFRDVVDLFNPFSVFTK